jgi:hypothetical protein
MQVTERWLPVVRYAGWYEVSNRGRVRGVDRVLVDSLGRTRRWRGQLLALIPDLQGYPTVRLWRDGRCELARVHTLVLTAFAGPAKPGEECRHGPGGKLDNRWPEAIRWGTPPENAADQQRDGTQARGERHGSSKLTAAIVRDCRRRRATGEPVGALARQYGVDASTMSNALTGRTWSHVA